SCQKTTSNVTGNCSAAKTRTCSSGSCSAANLTIRTCSALSRSSSPVFNRIDVPVYPSGAAALIGALPWLLLALFCLSVANAFPILWYGLALGVAAMAVTRFYRSLCRRPDSIVALVVDQDTLWIRRADDRLTPAVVAPQSRIGARLSLLKVSCRGTTKQTALIVLSTLPGMTNTDPATFRRLRVWLRLGGSAT